MLYGLDLFSGIGGISYALREWVRPIAYCECDSYCQGVLLSRMQSGDIEKAPIWNDVRNLKGEWLPQIDIIYGGFPCQDISVAGAGAGLEGERSGLFFEMLRLIKEIQPAFVFLENVPAIRTRGGERVVKELASLGYDCRWDCISAAEVGAPHKRERWFLLAANSDGLRKLQQAGPVTAIGNGSRELRATLSNPDSLPEWIQPGRRSGPNGQDQTVSGDDGTSESLANTSSIGSGEGAKQSGPAPRHSFKSDWWATEPDVGRVAHGVPARVDRIRGLGNAVVPLQAQTAFKRLMGID